MYGVVTPFWNVIALLSDDNKCAVNRSLTSVMNNFFLIGIHSMQDWTATTRPGVVRKKNHRKITAYRKFLYKEPTVIVNRCLLILYLKLVSAIF